MIRRPKLPVMPAPHDTAHSHFPDVADILGAEPGDWEFHRGVVDNTAFLCKLIPHDPPRQVFRLRITAEHHLPSTWISTLPESYRDSGIACTMDGDHLELTVPEATRYPPREIGILLHRSGIPRYCSLRTLTVLATAATVIAGEFIATTIMLYRLNGTIDLSEVLHVIIPLTLTHNILYAAAKLVFAASLAYAIHRVAGPKGSRLRL